MDGEGEVVECVGGERARAGAYRRVLRAAQVRARRGARVFILNVGMDGLVQRRIKRKGCSVLIKVNVPPCDCLLCRVTLKERCVRTLQVLKRIFFFFSFFPSFWAVFLEQN